MRYEIEQCSQAGIGKVTTKPSDTADRRQGMTKPGSMFERADRGEAAASLRDSSALSSLGDPDTLHVKPGWIKQPDHQLPGSGARPREWPGTLTDGRVSGRFLGSRWPTPGLGAALLVDWSGQESCVVRPSRRSGQGHIRCAAQTARVRSGSTSWPVRRWVKTTTMGAFATNSFLAQLINLLHYANRASWGVLEECFWTLAMHLRSFHCRTESGACSEGRLDFRSLPFAFAARPVTDLGGQQSERSASQARNECGILCQLVLRTSLSGG